MKKLLTIFLVLFISLTFNSYAIDFEYIPSKADAGLVDIATQFPGDFTNPELMLVGTIKQDIEHETYGTIPVALDTETGESTVWFYMFRSGDDYENIKAWAFAMVNYGGNEAGIHFPLETELLSMLTDNIPFTTDDVIPDDFDWINSDVMMAAVNENELYTDFMTANEDASIILAALAKTNLDEIETDVPVWGVIVANETDTLKLYIDAETGVVTDPGSSVYENVNTAEYKINVYPNPMSTTATVVVPEEIFSQNAELSLFDSFGREISNFEYSGTSIAVNNAANGTYYLKYLYGGRVQIVPIIINK